MARPTNKDDLLGESTLQYNKLMDLIRTMPENKRESEFLFDDRDRNVRDVIAHLYHWHLMMTDWYTVGVLEGKQPVIPGQGYTWKTLPALNLVVWESYQTVTLDEILIKFEQSHQQIMGFIKDRTNDELYKTKIYPWTKTTTLGAYFVSNTSSHYTWAQKKIRKHLRTS